MKKVKRKFLSEIVMETKDENKKLQELCRDYLVRLRNVACKHGLGKWLDDVIDANTRGECSSTEEEVEMLARLADDERLRRHDVPKVLGKSYRQCFENEDFEKVKRLRHVGVYSKVSVLLHKSRSTT